MTSEMVSQVDLNSSEKDILIQIFRPYLWGNNLFVGKATTTCSGAHLFPSLHQIHSQIDHSQRKKTFFKVFAAHSG